MLVSIVYTLDGMVINSEKCIIAYPSTLYGDARYHSSRLMRIRFNVLSSQQMVTVSDIGQDVSAFQDVRVYGPLEVSRSKADTLEAFLPYLLRDGAMRFHRGKSSFIFFLQIFDHAL